MLPAKPDPARVSIGELPIPKMTQVAATSGKFPRQYIGVLIKLAPALTERNPVRQCARIHWPHKWSSTHYAPSLTSRSEGEVPSRLP